MTTEKYVTDKEIVEFLEKHAKIVIPHPDHPDGSRVIEYDPAINWKKSSFRAAITEGMYLHNRKKLNQQLTVLSTSEQIEVERLLDRIILERVRRNFRWYVESLSTAVNAFVSRTDETPKRLTKDQPDKRGTDE